MSMQVDRSGGESDDELEHVCRWKFSLVYCSMLRMAGTLRSSITTGMVLYADGFLSGPSDTLGV